MDAALAGLLGTALGLAASLVGTVIGGRNQLRMEERRAALAQQADSRKAAHDALLHLTRVAATGVHLVTWLAWAATARPTEEFVREASDYDRRMRDLLPELVSAQVAVSSLAGDAAFRAVDDLVDELISLDLAVGTAAALPDAEAARAAVAEQTDRARELGDRLVRDVRSLLAT